MQKGREEQFTHNFFILYLDFVQSFSYIQLMGIEKDKIKEIAGKHFHDGLTAYIKRMGTNPSALSVRLGRARASIPNMLSSGSLPSFDLVYSLLDAGMTLEECFGPELAARIAPNQPRAFSREDAKNFARIGLAELLLDLQDPKGQDTRQA